MSALPCARRGVGTSPLVCKRVVEKSRVDSTYISLRVRYFTKTSEEENFPDGSRSRSQRMIMVGKW